MRFGTDVISGVPSIVMGIFAYTLIVLPQGHFSALAGGVRAGLHHAADHHPHHGRDAQAGAGLAARRLAGAGRAGMEDLLSGGPAGGAQRRGHRASCWPIARAAGEAAPMLFTAFGNPFMSTDLGQPIATLPHTDLRLRDLALRGLACQGLGDGAGADRAGAGAECPGAR